MLVSHRRIKVNARDDTVKVWDPIVRIGHWVLVIAFFTAYLTEDDFLTQHVWAGYAVGIIVCVRSLWGLIGTRHARFVDFVRSPAQTLRYIGDLAAGGAKRYIGHNPAGGAMVIALIVSLAGTVFSGLMVYAAEENAGPFAGWVADNRASESRSAPVSIADEELWEEVHEVLANFTLLLVVLHIAGVLFSSYVHKENLIRGMITGRKRRD